MKNDLPVSTVTENCHASSFTTLAWSVAIVLFVCIMSTDTSTTELWFKQLQKAATQEAIRVIKL